MDLERIKNLFAKKQNIPEDTRKKINDVENVAKLLQVLDNIATENEIQAREVERETEKLLQLEEFHKEQVLKQDLGEREKLNTLREIKRYRRRIDSLDRRHKIHQENIDLHLGLYDKIYEIRAMELKHVSQIEIEEIAVEYDEKLEKHRDILTSMHTSNENLPKLGSYEKKELEDLEKELLKEAGILDDDENSEKDNIESDLVDEENSDVTVRRTPIEDAIIDSPPKNKELIQE